MKTAVEWLIEQLENHNGITKKAFENVIKQAKAMEKEQIMDAFNEGFNEGCRYTTGFEQMLWEDDEQYYNETFKSE